MSVTLAVDLGVTGAFAVFGDSEPYELGDLPVAASRLVAGAVVSIIAEHGVDQVVVERIHAMPVVGSKGNFSQGHQLGTFAGICAAMQRPLHEVAPTAWKRAVGLGKDKDESRALAARLFPQWADSLGRKRDHNRAEALLLGFAFTDRGVR